MNAQEIITPHGRVLIIRAPQQLSDQQLRDALSSMADDDPRWLAVNQLIDTELAAAVLDVSTPEHKTRDHAGGRIEVLTVLKAKLLELRTKPPAPTSTRRPRRKAP